MTTQLSLAPYHGLLLSLRAKLYTGFTCMYKDDRAASAGNEQYSKVSKLKAKISGTRPSDGGAHMAHYLRQYCLTPVPLYSFSSVGTVWSAQLAPPGRISTAACLTRGDRRRH
jgi:hypothetical protein